MSLPASSWPGSSSQPCFSDLFLEGKAFFFFSNVLVKDQSATNGYMAEESEFLFNCDVFGRKIYPFHLL